MTAVRTGIKLFLTRSKLVQLYCNQWLYDYVFMHVFVCVKLSAFYSPCARIIVEDHVYSARLDKMCALSQIVSLWGFFCQNV